MIATTASAQKGRGAPSRGGREAEAEADGHSRDIVQKCAFCFADTASHYLVPPRQHGQSTRSSQVGLICTASDAEVKKRNRGQPCDDACERRERLAVAGSHASCPPCHSSLHIDDSWFDEFDGHQHSASMCMIRMEPASAPWALPVPRSRHLLLLYRGKHRKQRHEVRQHEMRGMKRNGWREHQTAPQLQCC